MTQTTTPNRDAEIRRTVYTSGLEIRAREDGQPSRTITGRAIVFGSESEVLYSYDNQEDREVIEPEAVTRELLDGSSILMTLYHDRAKILARSKRGKGTLSYKVDEKGVSFEFEAPNTVEGDQALELVRRGDIDGCSFAFSTRYWDEDYVQPVTEARDGKLVTVYHVRKITGIYDFTLTPDPAYPQTECEAERALFRDLHEAERKPEPETPAADPEAERRIRESVAGLRAAATRRIF